MVEIAISLAIIGVALVAIVGVLPLGMNVQQENRETTVINQDATIFIEAIRNGARGLDDLTNYVLAVTNFQTEYTYTGPSTARLASKPGNPPVVIGYNNPYLTGLNNANSILTNGANIIGLLGTPEFIDFSFNPTNNLLSGGYSNHVVAYVRSISGAAVEKPPQDNDIVRGDSFTYRLYAVNAPVAVDTNIFNLSAYPNGPPGYARQLAANLHELRLTFLWPQLPNGNTGSGRQTYRALVAGQIQHIPTSTWDLYFYLPQTFGSAP
jgi:type II secretory pathway pseudopilin PulG